MLGIHGLQCTGDLTVWVLPGRSVRRALASSGRKGLGLRGSGQFSGRVTGYDQVRVCLRGTGLCPCFFWVRWDEAVLEAVMQSGGPWAGKGTLRACAATSRSKSGPSSGCADECSHQQSAHSGGLSRNSLNYLPKHQHRWLLSWIVCMNCSSRVGQLKGSQFLAKWSHGSRSRMF